MAILVLRTVKGSPLTNQEVDNNFSNLNSDIGVLSNLTTVAKSNVVVALNETRGNVGLLSNLLTGTKANVVNAVNEVWSNVGQTAALTTLVKTSAVAAINEVRANSTHAGNITLGTLAAARLPTSGVSASTYGGTTQIPVLVVDTTGRITSASNVAVTSGVSSVGGATGAVSNAQIVAGFTADRVPGTNGNVLTASGGVWISTAPASSGITLTDQTSTATTQYVLLNAASTGSQTTANVSTTKLYYTPSTGTLNATVFNSLSDIAVKENINPVTGAVDIVSKMTGVEFDWKDNGEKSAGVVAQDIENVLPYLVKTSEEGMKSVNYSGIIAFLIQSVKELDSRLKKYEGR